jgi:hypothetical protein
MPVVGDAAVLDLQEIGGFPVRVIVNRRSCDVTLRSGGKPMTKLKLATIEDDNSVRLTIELPAAVHRSLVAYAEAIGREGGQVARQIRPSS